MKAVIAMLSELDFTVFLAVLWSADIYSRGPVLAMIYCFYLYTGSWKLRVCVLASGTLLVCNTCDL